MSALAKPVRAIALMAVLVTGVALTGCTGDSDPKPSTTSASAPSSGSSSTPSPSVVLNKDYDLDGLTRPVPQIIETKTDKGQSFGLTGSLGHAVDVAGDVVESGEGLIDVARDFVGGHGLRGDSAGDTVRHLVRVRDHAADFGNRFDRVAGRDLHLGDVRIDLAGSACRLQRERLHLCRDDGEALSGFSRPRRLDGGIEGEEVSL